ncbi:MAG: SpoIIE family protein phosphatase [Planctomycetota bacterium]|nr:SpoIIE family protein phosphatase [Planctomycetota bacterium]
MHRTSSTGGTTGTLRLVRIAGPEAPPIEIAPGSSARVGRAVDCDICLMDPTVSRNHCTLSARGDRWFIVDHGSRAGTLVNALAIQSGEPAPLEDGDLVSLGPWLFRVGGSGPAPLAMNTVDDSSGPATYVETIQEGQLGGMAQQRLSLLLDYASELNKARTEKELASMLIRAAVAGSGLTRAALIRPMEEGSRVEVIASFNAEGHSEKPFSISRSLVREAAAGRVTRMSSRMTADVAVSIADLGIHSALAAPVMIDAAVVAVLYIDARGGESRVRGDSADFCVTLSRLAGLAFANLKRAEIEGRRRELESELSAAREAQQLIIPTSGSMQGLRYRLAMQPGSFVAGDLFDVVPLSPTRTAVCIGDVTGHGVGAGILMAAAQSHLNATLRQHSDPALAVRATSAYLSAHSAPNRFVSLWVGVYDREARTLTFVDAGHGHWMHFSPDRAVHIVDSAGGPPLGVDPDFDYPAEMLGFEAGAATLLYSDGIIEQRSPSGEMFGRDRVREALLSATGPDIDPGIILDSVRRHAGTGTLDDDATAAMVAWDE